MRMSELSTRAGVSVATVKFYLREGLLAPGRSINAREASYSEHHVERLRLIRGLVHVLGASVGQVRAILRILDDDNATPLMAMVGAGDARPAVAHPQGEGRPDELKRARLALDQLGFVYDSNAQAVRELNAALSLADTLNIGMDAEQLAAYGEAARRVAAADLARITWVDSATARARAALGTVVYEPVLLALRRIAHQEQGTRHGVSPGDM